MNEDISNAQIIRKLQRLEPNEQHVYYRGHNLQHMCPHLRESIYNLMQQGLIHLVQRRTDSCSETGFCKFEFIAVGRE